MKKRESTRTGNLQLMKEINQVLLFNAIRENGPVSRAQLAKDLRLSPTTVTVIVDYFMENGFLVETGKGSSSGGRKPIMVKLAPNAGVVIAVDLEQRRAAVLNLEADILLEKIFPLAGTDQLVSSLSAVVNDLLHESRERDKVRLLGIGIAVSGIIDSDKGRVLVSSNLNIDHLSLKEGLQKEFNVPVLLENDANAAAFGEFLYGRGQQVENFIYIHAGKAIGSGLFLSGSLFTGGIGGAGEFGHITVDEGGAGCHCGNRGCLGKLISESSLLERWQEWNKGGAGSPTLTELVSLSNRGNKTAERLMDYAGDLLGKGIVTLIHLINPTLILLGGELVLNNERLLLQVRKLVVRRSIPMFSRHVQIEEGLIKGNAGIIGAGSLALHHFFENLNM